MKLLLAASALFLAPPALAQQTLGPGDQGADWGNITTSYPLGSAPADAYEPAEITPQGFTQSAWLDTGDQLATNFVVTNDATRDKKFRLTCVNIGPVLPQDFILGGVTHLHTPYGLQAWNGSSNYNTARYSPNSSCIGGPLFSQIYIQPQLLTSMPRTGAKVGVRDSSISVYYINGTQAAVNSQTTWVRRNHQMIIGPNPMNYNDAARRAVYAAAGFEYPGSPETPAGFGGYYCVNGPTQSTVVPVTLVKAQMLTPHNVRLTDYAKYYWGSGATDDPWGGGCVGYSAAVPALIIGNLGAPQCWDGNNLQMPNGRDHMWYMATTPDNATQNACPKTTSGASYRKLPEPTFKITVAVSGPSDYKYFYYSSDRMNAAGTAGDATSLDECRKVSAYFCGGSTLHADWGYGADSATFEEAQRECLGITVRGVAPVYANGAECNAGAISRYRALKTGTSPNSALSAGCTVILGCFDARPAVPKDYYIAIPGVQSGPTHIMRM